ncbi:MAG: hypothetical protein ACODAE_03085, partial [Gemmatimonadota bacterium]
MTVVPPWAAEKVLLSLYVLLLTGSMLYALHALRPEPGPAWLLPFPLVYNFPLHMGFYSFSLGVPLSLFAVGYVLRRRDRFDLRDVAALAVLLTLLYFAHLLTLALAVMAIGIVTAWRARRAVAATGEEQGSGDGRGAWQAVSGPLLAVLPAAILAASHVLRGRFTAWLAAVGVLSAVCVGVALLAGFAGTGRPLPAWLRAAIGSRATMPVVATAPTLLLLALVAGDAAFIGGIQAGPAPLLRLQRIWGVDALRSFRAVEGGVAIAFGALLAGVGLYHATAAVVHRRRAAVRDGLGWLFVAFVSLYLVAPNGLLGGGYVLPRLGLYV